MAPEALSLKSVAVLGGLLASCSPAAMNARDIPPNLQQFYDTVKGTTCKNPIKGGSKDGQGNCMWLTLPYTILLKQVSSLDNINMYCLTC